MSVDEKFNEIFATEIALAKFENEWHDDLEYQFNNLKIEV